MKILGLTIKPEVDKPIYYLHILVIAIVVLGILQIIQGGEMFTLKNVLWSVPLLTIADIFAHSLLKLD
jgi:hypothetical protein